MPILTKACTEPTALWAAGELVCPKKVPQNVGPRGQAGGTGCRGAREDEPMG